MNDGPKRWHPKSFGPWPVAGVAGPSVTTTPSRPHRDVRPFSQGTVTITLKYALPYCTFDACRTGEPSPRGADTNRRPAVGCTLTAGILDDRVAMHSFIPTSFRP